MPTLKFSHVILLLAAVSAAAPVASHAKTIGHYTAEISAKNEVGGQWMDFAASLAGWSCVASTYLSYSEAKLNSLGQVIQVPYSHKSDVNFPLIGAAHVSFDFDRNMLAKNPTTSVALKEYCHKTVVTTTTCSGSRGSYPCPSIKTKMLGMAWNCSMSQLPNQPGESADLVCKPEDYVVSNSLEGYLTSFNKSKIINAKFTLNKVEETYAKDFCDEEGKNRVALRLSQGVDQKRAIFHVKLDWGKKEFDLYSESGILDDEISYCSDDPKVAVTITASTSTSKSDQFWGTGGSETVVLDRSGAYSEGMIKLNRKGFFGGISSNQIRAEILAPALSQ